MPSPVASLLRLATLTFAMIRFAGIPALRHWLGLSISTREIAVSLRQFLDRGGLIYRKLGQYLAMRTDLLPPEVCQELDLLFEAVTPMTADEVVRLIEAELGRPLRACFAKFDPRPVGSASVAQVHRATSLDGQDLAVKVQRSGIQKQFLADVRVMRAVARFLDVFRVTGVLSLSELFDEFAGFTGRELDFEHEGRAADRLREGMSRQGHVPFVRWDLTTPRLLSMEFVEGETFHTLCVLSETGRTDELARILDGIDLQKVVGHLADQCFHQLFVTGLFHGDPHPANAILRKDGSFVFLDCGIYGELTPDHRRNFSSFVENLASGRFYESAQYYTRLCRITASTDVDAWMTDVAAALAEWQRGLSDPDAPIERRHMGRLQGNVAVAMRKHNVLTLPNQLLVWRALVLLDTTTLRLPIRFDVLGAMVSFFRRTRGDLVEILYRTCENWRAEVPRLGRNVVSPLSWLLVARRAPYTLSVSRSTIAGEARASHRPVRRILLALAALTCGTIAARTGGGSLGSIGALASTVLLALAASR
jgi:ubiquinone biosynthesis protein